MSPGSLDLGSRKIWAAYIGFPPPPSSSIFPPKIPQHGEPPPSLRSCSMATCHRVNGSAELGGQFMSRVPNRCTLSLRIEHSISSTLLGNRDHPSLNQGLRCERVEITFHRNIPPRPYWVDQAFLSVYGWLAATFFLTIISYLNWKVTGKCWLSVVVHQYQRRCTRPMAQEISSREPRV
jgi:hypothetical protein